MAKKRQRNRRKKLVLSLGTAAVLAAAAGTGVWFYSARIGESREDVLRTYMACIEKGDYETMYGLLSTEAKERVSQEEFITRNRNIYEGIEASDIQVEIEEDQKKDQPLSYRMTMNTIAGEYSCSNSAVFEKEKGKWKIDWEDYLIFPHLGSTDKVSVESVEAERGDLLDRNGNLLAGEGTVPYIGLVPGKMEVQPEETVEQVARLLGMSKEDVNGYLEASWVQPDSFVPLKKVTQEQLDANWIDESGKDTGVSLKEQLLACKGILISETESRVYPYGESTSHLLGYVQQINAEELEERKGQGYDAQSVIGKSGLEMLYEERLRAKDGYRISIKDEEGNEKEALAVKTAEDGEDIRLTIDIEWQKTVYEAYQEDKSASVVMNPMTGEILALVSTPSYNSLDFVLGLSQEQWDALNQDPDQPMYNRVREAWAPGSSFKPVTAAIGLSTGTLTAEQDLGASGLSWQKDGSWGDYHVTTLHEYGGGAVLKNALIYSDNIYFAKAALQIGADTFTEQLNKLGFGEQIPFEIQMTPSGYSNSETIESDIQLADSGYGQGQMLVNPLHLACIYSAFFQEGNMVQPYLEYQEGKTPSFWVEGAFTGEAANTVYEDLKAVVSDPNGTGHGASAVTGAVLAGKTGTAEIKTSQEDENGTELGWFAVYNTGVSEEDTRLMLTMVEDVKGRGGSGYVVEKDVEIWNRMTDQN